MSYLMGERIRHGLPMAYRSPMRLEGKSGPLR
jgi:hypothetical protein